MPEHLWKLSRAAMKQQRVPPSASDRDWLAIAVEIPIPLSARIRPGKGSGRRGAPKVAKWEPWKALGMSRTTYYRKQDEARRRALTANTGAPDA